MNVEVKLRGTILPAMSGHSIFILNSSGFSPDETREWMKFWSHPGRDGKKSCIAMIRMERIEYAVETKRSVTELQASRVKVES